MPVLLTFVARLIRQGLVRSVIIINRKIDASPFVAQVGVCHSVNQPKTFSILGFGYFVNNRTEFKLQSAMLPLWHGFLNDFLLDKLRGRFGFWEF